MLDFLGNGLGPQQLGPGGSYRVAFPIEVYTTPLLDLSLLASNIELVPAKPGHFVSRVATRTVIEQLSGTQSTAAQIRAGSDAAHTNFITSSNTPSNAAVNIGIATPFVANAAVNAPAVTVQKLVNAPIFMDVTVAATGTGGFILKVRFEMVVMWAAPG